VRKIILNTILLVSIFSSLVMAEDTSNYKKYLNKKKSQNDKDNKKKVVKTSELATSTTVINIKDTSSIELQRKEKVDELIPKIDRGGLQNDKLLPGWHGDLFDPRNQGGSGKNDKNKKMHSAFEMTYGLYNSVNGYITAGKELEHSFYQALFVRQRSESFKIGDSKIANSLSGLDFFHFNMGLNKGKLEFTTDIRINEDIRGLQANTNFSQLQKKGISANFDLFYVFNASSVMHLALSGGSDKFIIDNSTLEQSVNNGVGSLDFSLHFSGNNLEFLNFKINSDYEKSTSDDFSDKEIKNISFSIDGGFFPVKIVKLEAGFALNVVGFSEVQLEPSLKVSFIFSDTISFFGLVERKLNFPFFKEFVMKNDYSLYTALVDPETRTSFGGGFRWKIGSNLILTSGLYRDSYDKLYVVAADMTTSLFKFNSVETGLFRGKAELSYYLYKVLNLKFLFTQKMLDDNLAYYPNFTFDSTIEFTIEKTGTTLAAVGKFVGTRDDENGISLDPYWIMNLRIQQKIASGFNAVIQLANIFDAEYVNRNGYQETGFMINGGINMKF